MKSSLYPTEELKRKTLSWAAKLKVNPKMIRVQDMQTKWGSCSVSGTVTLARDLTEQEARFQDYVIVHELLHLRLPTHGRVFKALLSAHVPGWRANTVKRLPLDSAEKHVHSGSPRRLKSKGNTSRLELPKGCT